MGWTSRCAPRPPHPSQVAMLSKESGDLKEIVIKLQDRTECIGKKVKEKARSTPEAVE